MKRILFAFVVSFCSLFLFVSGSYAYTSGMSASVVVGQSSFTGNSADQGGATSGYGYNYNMGMVVIGNKLLVSDSFNYRILVYNTFPTSNNAHPDVVIGQPNFTAHDWNQGLAQPAANTLSSVYGLATDGTKLFVADGGNNRVLIFNRVPTSNNASADVVIGQTDMSNDTSWDATANTVSNPGMITYDRTSGKLLVSSYSHHRVLVYNKVPTTNGAAADVVIGQPNMTTRTSGTSSTKINNPEGMRVVDGKLILADLSNHRVLIYNSIPTVNGAAADVVIGQQNFTSGSGNQGGSAAANTLWYPYDVDYSNGELFIQDAGNNRVLVFNGIPPSNNASAYKVIGQPNLTTTSSGTSAEKLNDDEGQIAVANNRLFVGDSSSNRVVIFETSTLGLASNPEVDAQATSATILWKTNDAMSSLVEYGTSSLLGSLSTLANRNGVTEHQITLNGLSECTTYNYKAISNAATSNTAVSDTRTFTTKGSCSSFKSKWSSNNGDSFTFEPALDNYVNVGNYPTFVFTRAKDDSNGISSYQILVKDAGGIERTLIDNIPDSSSQENNENDDRAIFYDFGGNKISVRGKAERFKLENGAYKWRVKAINGKGAAILSSDRTLLVNTRQAVFSNKELNFPLSLLQVGSNKTNLVSYDYSSKPSKTLIVNSKPTFYGITNSAAHVKLSLVRNMGTWNDTYTFETNANDQSRFGINVAPALPKGTYTAEISATNDSGDYVELPTITMQVK